MVWSGKYYNPGEKKTFFFAVPMLFATVMKVNKSQKSIHLNFVAAKKNAGMYKIVREEAKKAEESTFNGVLTFSNGYQEVDVNLNFEQNSEFAIELVKEYQNIFAKSIQIKVVQPNSKVKRAMYITFDLAKGEVSDDERDQFAAFLNSLKK